MKQHARTMILSAFVADTLALGVHWIYDTQRIDEKYGRVTDFVKPSSPTYHPSKESGEFTHYGDQTLALLRSVADCGGFDRDHFSQTWRGLFNGYTGYFDGATKQTLKNMDNGISELEAGSASRDLAGAARIAPLVYCYVDNLPRLVESSRQQTALTHKPPEIADSAEFFSRVAWQVLHGLRPGDAMRRVAVETDLHNPIPEWVQAGMASASEDTRAAIGRLGQMCEAAAAFPATVHLIAKYEGRLEDALIENVMAGGDSAARGILAGMVLGAHGGKGAIPERWIVGLKALEQIDHLLAQIDARGAKDR
jgi:ADP-ribosylglycohydrolase